MASASSRGHLDAESEETLQQVRRRLIDVSEARSSIQGVAKWLIRFEDLAKEIVGVWTNTFEEETDQQLPLLWLCNEVCQNLRKTRSKFPEHWRAALPRCILAYSSRGSKEKDHALRLLKIWKTRKVFENTFIERIRRQMEDSEQKRSSLGKRRRSSLTKKESPSPSSSTQGHPVVQALKQAEEKAPVDRRIAMKAAALYPIINSGDLSGRPEVIKKTRFVLETNLLRLQEQINRREAFMKVLQVCLEDQRELIQRVQADAQICQKYLEACPSPTASGSSTY
mmetsp:Transcript_24496/g.34050  ORF Transcript_24496/g.34050 Transcript_24496/m.34050 type:complete len:282 (-) Transcript_24496:130-975(-)